MDPFGTPHVIVLHEDLMLLYMTYCLLSSGSSWTTPRECRLIPRYSNLVSNISWLTVSNAFEKSRKSPKTNHPLSSAFDILSTRSIHTKLKKYWQVYVDSHRRDIEGVHRKYWLCAVFALIFAFVNLLGTRIYTNIQNGSILLDATEHSHFVIGIEPLNYFQSFNSSMAMHQTIYWPFG